MANAVHTDPIYNDEDAARAHLEKLLWPTGPVCPHCGTVDEATAMKGKSHRKGLYNCRACDEPFTVTVGTVFESSHIPLHKWVYGMHLMAASKKGVSALQLQRQLGLGSYRTAWFMAHRIREALRDTDPTPVGGEGKIVEADETYYGKPAASPKKLTSKGTPFLKGVKKRNSRPVVALVERGGKAKVFHVAVADKEIHIASDARNRLVMTWARASARAPSFSAEAEFSASASAPRHGGGLPSHRPVWDHP